MKDNLFQMSELEALLGEYKDDFDIDGIIDDATRIDADGDRVWTAFGDELNDILARHEKDSGNPTVTYDVYECRMIVPHIFNTEEEARAYVDSIKSTLTYEIVHTRRGFDTIVYDSVWIERNTYDSNDDDIVASETIEQVDGLDDGIKKLMSESERSYHAYLDYMADSYHGIG